MINAIADAFEITADCLGKLGELHLVRLLILPVMVVFVILAIALTFPIALMIRLDPDAYRAFLRDLADMVKV